MIDKHAYNCRCRDEQLSKYNVLDLMDTIIILTLSLICLMKVSAVQQSQQILTLTEGVTVWMKHGQISQI